VECRAAPSPKHRCARGLITPLNDPSPFQVRNYAPGDIDALVDLFRKSVRITAGRDYTQEQVLAWAPDEIDRSAGSERCANSQTLVAELQNSLVGFAILESDGHLDMMYVHPEHQGKGIASALLEHVERFARRHGLARLYTEASITARPYFEHRGFRLIAPQAVSTRGQDFINYRMEKQL
jgi:putative acetyltransferase